MNIGPPLIRIVWLIVTAPDDICGGGVFGGMIGRGNRSTQRKPAAVPFCPPHIPHGPTKDRTWAAAVGSLCCHGRPCARYAMNAYEGSGGIAPWH
jgi:hypothetical protein